MINLANIILNDEKVKAFMMRNKIPILVTYTQHSIGSPSHSNQLRKRDKRNQNLKGKCKTILFLGNMIL